MPKVSVVVPTHNRAAFLREAISSVLDQTFQDFEIIVVDDASEDETSEVVRGFADNRIKYIRHDVGRRVAATRNTGISHSLGRYIAFLDDDDSWLKDKLQRQLDLIESSSANTGVVYTSFTRVETCTVEAPIYSNPTKKRGHLLNELSSGNWVGTASTVLLKRECLDKVGLFDEQIDFGEEYDLWIRISREFDFEYIEEPLVVYRVHEKKLSTDYNVMIRGKEAQLQKHAQLFAANRKNYGAIYLDLGVLYCYTNNVKKGREAFLRAIVIYPCELRCYFNYCISLFGARNFKRLKEIKAKALQSR
jgi:glycosyltransferase involved in cell wall biosynthesis